MELSVLLNVYSSSWPDSDLGQLTRSQTIPRCSSAVSTSQGPFLAGFVHGATQFQRLRHQDISSMDVKCPTPVVLTAQQYNIINLQAWCNRCAQESFSLCNNSSASQTGGTPLSCSPHSRPLGWSWFHLHLYLSLPSCSLWGGSQLGLLLSRHSAPQFSTCGCCKGDSVQQSISLSVKGLQAPPSKTWCLPIYISLFLKTNIQYGFTHQSGTYQHLISVLTCSHWMQRITNSSTVSSLAPTGTDHLCFAHYFPLLPTP